MIRLGKHVTQAADQLIDISIEKFYKALINSNGEVASLQLKLQAIRAMDPAQYRRLKTTLPYVVCAQFHPKVRRKENFLFADRFLIDIDHIAENDLDIAALREMLKKDNRVELMFGSPSGDGLKVLFKIDPKITDSAYYVLFYKAFCIQFNHEYQLGAALDLKTHDVSRCCFVSFDPEAYYNPEAIPLHPEAFVQKDSFFEMEQIEKKAKEIEKQHTEVKRGTVNVEKVNSGQDLPSEVLAFIKEKTGQKSRKPKEKQYEQPDELNWVMDSLQSFLAEINAEIEHVRPIAYGRQVKVRSGHIWAEVNVFFGKRGVSIVGTTKTGSHKEFGKTLTEYLKASFDS
ncbi:CRISPR-associated primase-polymerase type B [Belliella sp. DSM 111904]|uniref:CRISPR-associated primase-polymerase type B n=1 Tax=Belliella filtrata TaxID=2923435 RepID=A0ABS9V662_9BACT|nr:CRISPR-associated primase-polymerase type B [Belliella filtrata]MCH7411430.1 CRISPR-associated primase-polymerase type B [Belliella filtrata]